MRRFAVVASLAIVVACDSYGEERASPDATSTSETDASSQTDAGSTSDAGNDVPTDALDDASSGCGTPAFLDSFERTTVQGNWETLKTEPSISLSIAQSGAGSPSAFLVQVTASSVNDRVAYLEKAMPPTSNYCRELEFQLSLFASPTNGAPSLGIATLEFGKNGGALVVELRANSQIWIIEQFGAMTKPIVADTLPNQTFVRVILRASGASGNAYVNGEIGPTKWSAARTLTGEPVTAIRIGAPIPKTAGASYAFDEVVIR